MRLLIPLVMVLSAFVLGWLSARLARTPPDVKRAAKAGEALDDISVMAAERSVFGDPLATLVLERIDEYRKETR